MKTCGNTCIITCDFCIHVKHEQIKWNNKIIDGAPIGCSLYDDKRHQEIAEDCGHCESFHCICAKEN